MSIPEQVIEQIRTASDIVSVISDYITDLKKAGRNFKCCCPFHTEKTPSFVVSPEKGIFRCFGCGVAGDVFKFVMLIENISWIESVKKLAEKNGIRIQEDYSTKYSVSEKTKIFELLEFATRFYNRCLLDTKSASFARKYVKQRGITDDSVRKFMIGYAPKGKLLEFAIKKGYTYEILVKSGLFPKSDFGNIFEYMSERLVFPISDVQGRVVAFGGRALGNSKAKYLNTPETIVYSKKSNLYGLYQALPELRKEKSIVIVEGYMDVVLLQQHGIYGAVAPLGTAFTQQQAKLVGRYADNITLLFDPDYAGKMATQRVLEICAGNNMPANVSTLPDGFDPDEYLLKYGKEEFYKLVGIKSKSAISFVFDEIASKVNISLAQEKAKVVSRLLDFINKNENIIVQREYVRFIAQKLNIEEDIIWHEFRKRYVFKTNIIESKESKIVENIVIKTKFSLEEKLINFLLNICNRQYIKKLKENFFKDVNCIVVYDLLLKKERKILEKEVLLMSEGKKEIDNSKIEKYRQLTAQIKGSRKK